MDRNIVSIMQQACIFAVIAQMIFYFRPNDTYEKYLKLLIGMILIAVLFVPLLDLFHLADAENFQTAISSYEENIQKVYEKMYDGEVDFEELKNQISGSESQLSAIEKEIKTRINNLKGLDFKAETVKITGVTYIDGQNDLTEMKVQIQMSNKENGLVEIEVDPIQVKGETENEDYEVNRIKELLEEELGIEKERMIINLNE